MASLQRVTIVVAKERPLNRHGAREEALRKKRKMGWGLYSCYTAVCPRATALLIAVSRVSRRGIKLEPPLKKGRVRGGVLATYKGWDNVSDY